MGLVNPIERCWICTLFVNSANVNAIFQIIPMYTATLTHRRWLRSVKFTLEGTVTSEVRIPVLSHIPIGRGRAEWGPEI
jgi:hypothetical protein